MTTVHHRLVEGRISPNPIESLASLLTCVRSLTGPQTSQMKYYRPSQFKFEPDSIGQTPCSKTHSVLENKMTPSTSFQTFVLVILCSFIISSSSGSEIRRKREDSLRCLPFNGFFCRWSCRLLGHSDGFCDQDNECRCSEEGLEKYVCGGNVTETAANNLCAGWCQFRGLQTGDCNTDMGVCECTEGDRLSTRHIKCINEEVCSIYCQFKEKKSSGICSGKNDWECICLSKDENRNEIETLGN